MNPFDPTIDPTAAPSTAPKPAEPDTPRSRLLELMKTLPTPPEAIMPSMPPRPPRADIKKDWLPILAGGLLGGGGAGAYAALTGVNQGRDRAYSRDAQYNTQRNQYIQARNKQEQDTYRQNTDRVKLQGAMLEKVDRLDGLGITPV